MVVSLKKTDTTEPNTQTKRKATSLTHVFKVKVKVIEASMSIYHKSIVMRSLNAIT